MPARIIAFLAMLVYFSVNVSAANVSPDQLVETTVNELIDELESRRAELEQDKGKLYGLVEEVVVPHFELNVIARLVLARHWRDASEAQRSEFARQFKNLLVRTYATALFEYTGKEKMTVKPARIVEGERRTRVESQVTLPGGPPIPVNYSFLLTDAGEWKIYDVDIEGISLVTNYRSSYGQFIREKGLDALIDELAAKTASLENS